MEEKRLLGDKLDQLIWRIRYFLLPNKPSSRRATTREVNRHYAAWYRVVSRGLSAALTKRM